MMLYILSSFSALKNYNYDNPNSPLNYASPIDIFVCQSKLKLVISKNLLCYKDYPKTPLFQIALHCYHMLVDQNKRLHKSNLGHMQSLKI
jgi:hypothetical protein